MVASRCRESERMCKMSLQWPVEKFRCIQLEGLELSTVWESRARKPLPHSARLGGTSSLPAGVPWKLVMLAVPTLPISPVKWSPSLF